VRCFVVSISALDKLLGIAVSIAARFRRILRPSSMKAGMRLRAAQVSFRSRGPSVPTPLPRASTDASQEPIDGPGNLDLDLYGITSCGGAEPADSNRRHGLVGSVMDLTTGAGGLAIDQC